jgi:hypothetical protein
MGLGNWLTGIGTAKKVDEPKTEPKTETPRRRKIDRKAAAERARENSPWRYDDGPCRRGRS